jgi:branched-chain amino acid aminotransferase
MSECFGKSFLLNGQLFDSGSFDNSMVYDGESIYEVIRVSNGMPLFLDDHLARLESSAGYRKKVLPASRNELRRNVSMLLDSEGKKDVNMKIVINYNNGKTNMLIYLLKPSYPTADQYENGVTGILFYAERKDPESKVINHELRTEIYQRLIAENAYEALLVNRNNCITEGSRSNIFFISGNELLTAPDKEVLGGITRMHLIQICRERNIRVGFRCVGVDEIRRFDSVFMTGTSPVVLPFCRIDDFTFNVNHEYIRLLRSLYLEKAKESINRYMNENPLR